MTTTTTRRAVLAGAAALPALAAPAAFANVGTDPMFDAIEAHRRAYAERLRCLRIADALPDAPPLGAVEAADAATKAEYGATIDMLNTTPTTMAGMAALARYVCDFGEEEFQNIYTDDDVRWPFAACVIQKFADDLEALAAPGKAVLS